MDLIKMKKEFPEDFLFGASTSSFQFEGGMYEGGRGASVIDNFRLSKNVTTFEHGSDHYHRWEEDIRLAHECKLKSYRFSISWSRVLPNGNGQVNQEGLQFYRNIFEELKKYGIEPIVTIYHFDYPQGLVDQYGGWIDRRSIQDFVDYCELLYREFGQYVKYWLTINEQDHVMRIAARMGLSGNEANYHQLRYQANHNMCVATALAIKSCHEICPEARIGPALSYLPVYPKDCNPVNILAANDVETLMVSYLTELHCKGVYPIRLWKYLSDRDILPVIEEGDMELMKQYPPDYLAVNYYATYTAEYLAATKEHPIGQVEGALLPMAEYGVYTFSHNEKLPKTKFGWTIDAVGLRILLENLYERYNLPIMITENGFSHPDEFKNETVIDDYRIEYIREHLKQINLAINTGVEVLGYHLWSFIDLISGREGFVKRYGLVYVNRDDFDLKDMKRYKKKSFDWYRNVIESNGGDL